MVTIYLLWICQLVNLSSKLNDRKFSSRILKYSIDVAQTKYSHSIVILPNGNVLFFINRLDRNNFKIVKFERNLRNPLLIKSSDCTNGFVCRIDSMIAFNSNTKILSGGCIEDTNKRYLSFTVYDSSIGTIPIYKWWTYSLATGNPMTNQ